MTPCRHQKKETIAFGCIVNKNYIEAHKSVDHIFFVAEIDAEKIHGVTFGWSQFGLITGIYLKNTNNDLGEINEYIMRIKVIFTKTEEKTETYEIHDHDQILKPNNENLFSGLRAKQNRLEHLWDLSTLSKLWGVHNSDV